MNAAIQVLVQQEIAGLYDELYHYRLQKTADKNWRSGNGQSCDEIIAQLEERLLVLQRRS